MRKIAETTGGVYISVDEAAELSNAMTTAATSNTSRDLVSTRNMRKLNLLYGFLRILFVTLLGTLIGGLVAFAYGNQDSYIVSTVASAVTSLIGALLMELLTGPLHLNDRFAWLFMWIFIALTILLKRYMRGIKAADLYQMDNGMYGQDYGAYGQDGYYNNDDYQMY